MVHTISRAVVIGSGTMGGGIAAHFANAGVPVYLLDVAPRELLPVEHQRGLKLDDPRVRNRIVNASLDRLKKNKPAAFFTPATADLVTIGNLEDNEGWLSEGDWIVEAIVENLEAKREIVARIDRLRKPGSIISSNTSGLPIASIAAEASGDFKAHFLGTHFFNPPRYMKLLEVIPSADTLPEVTAFVSELAEQRLGKSVVFCKDTPNFIANRLASVSSASMLDFVLENGYTVEETDAIAGPLIGRPKTAAFRLWDLVGLDVASSVGSNLYGLIEQDESREVLRSSRLETLLKNQTERGRLGDKTGQGFYKKGGKEILSLDLNTGEYRARLEPEIATVAEGSKIRNLKTRLDFVLRQDDKAGALARRVVYNALGYAARRVPEISDDLTSIDNAVRWGFSHDLGPFETWDSLGVKATADAMEAGGVAVAPWVREMLAAGNESFYREAGGRRTVYDPATKTYVPIATNTRAIVLADLKKAGRVVRENRGASLIDVGDGVLCLEFHTKMNTLDDQIRAMLVESVQEVERGDWAGLIIGNEGGDFCVGANLAGDISSADPQGLDNAVKGMQDALMAVRFCTKPVVTAPFGRTLAGGAEVVMAGARIVADSETYMGLVEVGVGLVPGAGGCKEMVRRVVSPAIRKTPNADPVPLVQNVMQTVGAAKVSSSAAEARDLGFLTESDRIVMNREHLLFEAKREVLELAATGYAPPAREASCYAGGRDVLAALRAGIYGLQQGGYMSEYDALISVQLAHIVCGGNLSSGQWVVEQYLLDLEREAFVQLCCEPKTIERIQHMLSTGKPLRN